MATVEVCGERQQVFGRIDPQIGYEACLVEIRCCDDQAALRAPCGQGGRQDGAHRAQVAGQTQFSGELVTIGRVFRQLFAADQNADRDGKIETAALFG